MGWVSKKKQMVIKKPYIYNWVSFIPPCLTQLEDFAYFAQGFFTEKSDQ